VKILSEALDAPAFWNRIQLVARASHVAVDKFDPSYYHLSPRGKAYLGKLGFKLEPAGKVRVFAMADA